MGTRSLTFVHDNVWGPDEDPLAADPIVCVYQQYDGDFDGVGTNIVDFLAGAQMVNGISMGNGVRQFNGAGDLAARLITHFKDGDADTAGGVYIELPNQADDDMGAEYAYHIYVRTGEEPYIRAIDNYAGRTVEGFASKIILSDNTDG